MNGFHEEDGENFRTSHFDFEHFATAASVAKELLTVLGPILKCNTNLKIKKVIWVSHYVTDAVNWVNLGIPMVEIGAYAKFSISQGKGVQK